MTLHLFMLMLSLLSGGSARVVQDFEQECGTFFANGKSPTRRPEPQYRQICQNLDNIYYYATYYDTYNRIPVYSAYKFTGKMDCDRLEKWLIEPQYLGYPSPAGQPQGPRRWSYNVGDGELAALGGMKFLRKLTLAHLPGILKETGLIDLIKGCKDLHSLSLANLGSLKTMNYTLALLEVVSYCTQLRDLSGLAKVVKDFASCREFFANGQSPTTFTAPQYKQICQTLNGVAYYATYYDTVNKIPVYSAYKFKGKMGCTRKSNWYIEPQLHNKILGENMASEGTIKDKNLRGVHQALNEDYEKSGFDRGHLAPVYHADSQSCADATFTLTNAAPQDRCFNRIFWWDVEEELAESLEKNCKSQPVYIVTGVVPGPGKISNNRVNVPSYFWTAFCCLDQNNRCSPSGGVIGSNDSYNNIIKMTVADLEENLKNYYGTTFKVFQY